MLVRVEDSNGTVSLINPAHIIAVQFCQSFGTFGNRWHATVVLTADTRIVLSDTSLPRLQETIDKLAVEA